VGAWPNLPRVEDMAPPLALTMPGIPKPDAAHDVPADEEGAFVPPSPDDPANPTGRETLAVALAVVTAMGVAAAQGMWHRARRRAALADEARAAADRSLAKAAGAEKAARAKQGAKQASPSGGGGGKAGGRKRRGGHDREGSRTGPGRGGSPKGPKARKDGRTPRRKDRDEPRRRKDRPGWRKRRDDDARGRKRKRPDTKRPKPAKTPKGDAEKRRPKRNGKGWTFRPGKNRPKREKPKTPKRDRMSWKAPKRKPGPGQDQAIAGRRRWRGRGAKPGKWHRKSWGRRAWKRGRKWVTRWQHRRRFRRAAQPAGRWWTAFKRRGGRRRAWSRRWFKTGGATTGSHGAYAPPPGFGGMRPPPGADRTVRVEHAERVDKHGRPYRKGPEATAVAGAPASGWPALPPGSASPAPTAPPARPPASPAPNPTSGVRPVATPNVPNTQYRDADLTIYDVIDADMDMAEEIGAGAAEAYAAADGCDQLMTRLEAVRAKVVELGVPGLLAGWLIRLMDKTLMVKASAVAIAAELPAASEAIAVAGANAAARHRPLADVTRDMGHVRPAAREYHDE
jgi:hypothetical protein